MAIKIENVVTPSAEQWEAIIRGTRNPMNSWDKSDSFWQTELETEDMQEFPISPEYIVGRKDLDLMKRLVSAGTDHRKFMRMITVYVDVTAPLYWWKEFDTYKVGTVRNSCSTMHKIAEKEFTFDDFSHEHLITYDDGTEMYIGDTKYHSLDGMIFIIDLLNHYRNLYLETKDKKYWHQLIQLLPSSYNQRATLMLNYEVLANMYHSRKNHKLDEWVEFCKWIETLPYSELITGANNKDLKASVGADNE